MKLPAHWTTVTVGDVFTVQLGKMLSEKAKAGTAPYPYLGNKHVQWGQFDLSDLPTMDFSTAEREKFSLRDGDLLVCEGGEVGRAAIWRGQARNCYYQKALHRLRPKSGSILPEYMYRFLQVAASRDMFSGLTSQTSIAHLTKEKLEILELPLPPLPEQKRIAAILDKADAIRKKRQKAIRLTEELLRSAFLEMCGPRAKDYARWPLRTIESLARGEKGSMRTGPFGSDLRHSEFVEEGVAVLGIDNAVQNRFAWGERRFITEEKYESLRRYTVRPGDVIVTIMGTTGRSAVVPDDIPTAITTKHLATITLDRNVAEPEFVAQALHRHPDVLTQIANAHRGAIMNGLNLGLIKSLEVRLPPIEVQRGFVKVTAAVRQSEEKITRASRISLSDVLTQRAFSGKL